MEFLVRSIGVVRVDDEGFRLEIDPEYIPALEGLEGFGYINVVWWCDGYDDDISRAVLTEHKPYKAGPETLGVFATRSPIRPNPVAVSTAYVCDTDRETGIITLGYIDARDGTPIIDIKPYTPSIDRVEAPTMPDWCAHWPKNVETSGDFDWSKEFNF